MCYWFFSGNQVNEIFVKMISRKKIVVRVNFVYVCHPKNDFTKKMFVYVSFFLYSES